MDTSEGELKRRYRFEQRNKKGCQENLPMSKRVHRGCGGVEGFPPGGGFGWNSTAVDSARLRIGRISQSMYCRWTDTKRALKKNQISEDNNLFWWSKRHNQWRELKWKKMKTQFQSEIWELWQEWILFILVSWFGARMSKLLAAQPKLQGTVFFVLQHRNVTHSSGCTTVMMKSLPVF